MRRQILVLAAVLAFLWPACTQAEIVYEVIDLGSVNDLWASCASSINEAGQVVGWASVSDTWLPGPAVLFDPTGAGNNIVLGHGQAYSINDSGQIVGWVVTENGGATLFDATGGGNNIYLGTLGRGGEANSINNLGQIVGVAENSEGQTGATLFDATGGNNIDLGTFAPSGWSVAYSINDAGQIVGYAHKSESVYHATLFDPSGAGNNIDLGTLGGTRSWALSINNLGQIVGKAENSEGQYHATLFNATGGGNNIDLGTLAPSRWGWSVAESINDAGQIVGMATDDRGTYCATMFDPSGAGNNIDLNTLIDPASGHVLSWAYDINNSGWIVGWSGVKAFLLIPKSSKYSGGTGEPNDPYQIATAEDLILLGETPEDYDKHFILTADIDLDPNLPGRKVFDRAVIAPDVNDVNYDWDGNVIFDGTPFTGAFDGNGHTISNLTIISTGYIGLFGRLSAYLFGNVGVISEVRDLGLVDVNITGSINSSVTCLTLPCSSILLLD